MEYKNLFEILEIDETNNKELVKKAYKNLSLKYHPDKNLNNHEVSSKKFIKITEAYKEIIKEIDTVNDEKILEYDNSVNNINLNAATKFFKIFMENQILENENENNNLVKKLNITLEDIFTGCNKIIDYKRYICCLRCNGKGNMLSDEEIKCYKCYGKGIITIIKQNGLLLNEINMPCEECDGYGQVFKLGNKCLFCNGKKKIIKNEKIKISLDKGMDKEKIVISKKGNFDTKNLCYRDLEIKFNLLKHPLYKKKNNDLILKYKISLCSALVDNYIIFSHLDNRKIIAEFDDILILNKLKYVKNEGMPIYNNPEKRGDLIIKFIVKYPKTINNTSKMYLKKILPYKENIHDFNNYEKKEMYDLANKVDI